MAKFFKYLLATFLGGILACLVFIVFFFAIVASIATFGSEKVVVKDNSVLWLNLNGPIVEQLTSNPLQDLLDGMSDKPANRRSQPNISKHRQSRPRQPH
jgi:protease IV